MDAPIPAAANRRLCTVLLMLMALLIACLPSQMAGAQAPSPSAICAILLLDNSQSMSDHDPQNLRFTAARLFLALLDEGDAAGIVVFATESQAWTEGAVTVGGAADKRDLMRRLEPIAASGLTDIKAAFVKAQPMLQGASASGQRPVLVLLTDGYPQTAQPYADYEAETLALARDLGVPILAIALTPRARTPFLSRLCAETGGQIIPADEASDLLDAYLEVLGQIKDRTIIGGGTAPAPGMVRLGLEPGLAPYVQKISFVVGKSKWVAARLLGPDGQEVGVGDHGVVFSVTDDPDFAVVTVEQPVGGDWGFALDGAGTVQARAILRSRLRLAVLEPHHFHEAGQPVSITVQLKEEGLEGQVLSIIGEASFSATITRPDGQQESLDRFYDDGTHGDARADDGQYARLYVTADQPGPYTLSVRGWKGMIPVERTTRFEAIRFPTVVIDKPDAETYEIRNAPVPLQAHLEGGEPSGLDQGEIVALVTSPVSGVTEIALAAENGIYTGSFMPTEDGVHVVSFEPRGATYRAMAYTHGAQAEFRIRRIPVVTVQASPIDLGPVEISHARQGITLYVPVSSTSTDAEMLQVHLEAMPALHLIEGTTFWVPPGGESLLAVPLTPGPDVSAGGFQGRLVFSAREGVNLEGAVVPLQVRLFQPVVRLVPVALDAGMIGGCLNCSERLALTFEFTGPETTTVQMGLQEAVGLDLGPQTVILPPGTTEVSLTISPTGELPVGNYEARLTFEAGDEVRFEPGPAIPLRFRVASPWVRCRVLIVGGGILLLLGSLGMAKAVRRRLADIRPPLVTGTLRPRGRGVAAQDIDLTVLQRTAVTLGRDGHSDVKIADPLLRDRHAILRAERSMDEVRIVLEPLGKVARGYRILQGAIQLQHGDTFTMGGLEFEYLSDKGE